MDPADLDKLPDYNESELNAVGDTTMYDTVQTSIEEDEGISMNDTVNDHSYDRQNYQSGFDPRSNWQWNAINNDEDASTSGGLDGLESLSRNNRSNLVSGAASDMEIGSDFVDDNSSANAEERRDRLKEFDDAEALDFHDPSPVPDMDDMGIASGVALRHDMYDNLNGFESIDVPPEMEVEEPAAEIHIGEDDDLKLD